MYEGQICVCCMATDDLLDLFIANKDDEVRDYAKIMLSCFSLKLSRRDGHRHICSECAKKLDSALEFRNQIEVTLSILSATSNYDRITPKAEVEYESDTEPVKDKEETPWNSPTPQKAKPRYTGPKRKRGRPRKNPESKLPYTLKPNELTCRECNEEFPTMLSLRGHLNIHFRNHNCDLCDKGFISLAGLRKHKQTHLSGPFKCPICDSEFNNVNTLQSHRRLKHSSLPLYQCRICGERFSTVSQRQRHLLEEHQRTELPFKCKHCDKRFSLSSSRSTHMRKAHDTRVFACQLCPYKSKQMYMRLHLANRHHIGEKRHACPHCPKRFTRRITLKEHIRIHIGERRFKCLLCQRAFVQKCSLKSHLKTHQRRGDFDGDIEPLLNHKQAKREGGFPQKSQPDAFYRNGVLQEVSSDDDVIEDGGSQDGDVQDGGSQDGDIQDGGLQDGECQIVSQHTESEDEDYDNETHLEDEPMLNTSDNYKKLQQDNQSYGSEPPVSIGYQDSILQYVTNKNGCQSELKNNQLQDLAHNSENKEGYSQNGGIQNGGTQYGVVQDGDSQYGVVQDGDSQYGVVQDGDGQDGGSHYDDSQDEDMNVEYLQDFEEDSFLGSPYKENNQNFPDTVPEDGEVLTEHRQNIIVIYDNNSILNQN